MFPLEDSCINVAKGLLSTCSKFDCYKKLEGHSSSKIKRNYFFSLYTLTCVHNVSGNTLGLQDTTHSYQLIFIDLLTLISKQIIYLAVLEEEKMYCQSLLGERKIKKHKGKPVIEGRYIYFKGGEGFTHTYEKRLKDKG